MLNLAFGWIWIVCGFGSGAVIGLGYHRPDYLGGYDAWARRLVRLGHIAFFGTGGLNILFALSRAPIQLPEFGAQVASWAFVVGAFAMPVCCFIAARFTKAKSIFVIPVAALTTGGVLAAYGAVIGAMS